MSIFHSDVALIPPLWFYTRVCNGSAAGLCEFLAAIVMYYDIVVTVEPKRQALKQAQEDLVNANVKLAEVQAFVADLEAKLAVLVAEFDKVVAEKNRVVAEGDRLAVGRVEAPARSPFAGAHIDELSVLADDDGFLSVPYIDGFHHKGQRPG